MEIKYEKTPVGFIQTREQDGKKYYCLYQIMKALGYIPDQITGKPYEGPYVSGNIIYSYMHIAHSFVLSVFIEEEGFNKLVKGRCK
nr:MAG TPA: hypothetical protein [Caudoviricetes sp.]